MRVADEFLAQPDDHLRRAETFKQLGVPNGGRIDLKRIVGDFERSLRKFENKHGRKFFDDFIRNGLAQLHGETGVFGERAGLDAKNRKIRNPNRQSSRARIPQNGIFINQR